MKYSELVDFGVSSTQRMDYLSEEEPMPITFSFPRNLEVAAADHARLRGVSFSAFIRSCIINELSEGD